MYGRLNHKRIFAPPVWLERATSTNDLLLRQLRQGAALPHGYVLAAREQTHGRGRGGRTWLSPPDNLHASLLLRLDVPGDRLASLPLLLGVAVALAVQKFAVVPALKWPNDVLLKTSGGWGKFSGILCECAGHEAGAPWIVVCGLGCNINALGEQLRHVGQPAASLRMLTGTRHNPEILLREILTQLERLLPLWLAEGYPCLAQMWRQLALPWPPRVCAHLAGKDVCGKALGLGPQGQLLLQTAQGVQEIWGGETHCNSAPDAQ